MPFSSLLFLTAFLPLFCAIYWASPRIAKNAVLLAFSVIFYGWGAPRLLPVMLLLGILDFFAARRLVLWRGLRRGQLLLASLIVVHLSVLAYFKYSNFFVAETNALLVHIRRGSLAWHEVALPIGISFLTFEEISYVVDVYRGDAEPARHLGQYLLFLMLFPHSIAGPIFRWKDLESQLQKRSTTLDDIVEGLTRFIWGLAKKILIADAAASVADPIFALAPERLPWHLAWLGALAYAIQIYFDFSGYSSMAVGLGRMAGFHFKENFNFPYVSQSIGEFWTRWHISLSTWLRDYLYVPLGGNRGGEAKRRRNILIVFALSGLWHGAAPTFVFWGIYHGLLVVFERTSISRFLMGRIPAPAKRIWTLALVVVGWVFFRAPTFGYARRMFAAMIGLGTSVAEFVPPRGEYLSNRALFALLSAVALSQLEPVIAKRGFGWSTARVLLAPVVIALCVTQIVNTKFNPLIYFKF